MKGNDIHNMDHDIFVEFQQELQQLFDDYDIQFITGKNGGAFIGYQDEAFVIDSVFILAKKEEEA